MFQFLTPAMLDLLWRSLGETLIMTGFSSLFTLIFGLPQWIARETRAGHSVPDIDVVTEELSALMRKMFTVNKE